MSPTLCRCLVVTLFLGGSTFGRAESQREPDFISTCFIASGVSDSCELANMLATYFELRQRINLPELRTLPMDQRARELHSRLHREVLTGNYQSAAFDLRQTLRLGDYNCLSALAIYYDLARDAGIELQIWSRPGHVHLVCEVTGERIEPGDADWQGERTGRLTPPARLITSRELVGKFYYNRGLVLLQQGRHAEGLELIRTSLRLDPHDPEARSNLLAGLNNWAVTLVQQDRVAEARLLIGQGLRIDAGYAPLVANARLLGGRPGR
jgi:tetratricopeptide (TPR) repeat protein